MKPQRAGAIVRIAARNFLRYRLQAVLIAVATMSGTAGVIVSAGYAAGGRQKVFDQFSRLGTNVIIVSPQQSKSVGGRARTGALVTTLTASDYAAIQRLVPGIAKSSASVSAVLRLRAGDLTKNVSVIGCEPGYFDIKHWRTTRGAIFDDAADRQQTRTALLGVNVSRDLFGDDDPTGARITVNKIPFVVAGVLAERGQGLDAANEDDQIYVPVQTAMHRLMNVDYFTLILFAADDWSHMDKIAHDMNDLLAARHRTAQSSAADYQIQSQKTLIDTQLVTFNRLTFLMQWISVSALVVSSLGVFALTWLGVRNRTQEIGTRRAIGAVKMDIFIQFFTEASLGGFIGCGTGLGLSYVALRIIDNRVAQPFVFSPGIAAVEATLSVLLYSTFALLSSLRAIGIEPLVALHSE